MSMEIYVLSERRLVSIQEWQRSIDAIGVSMKLSTGTPFAKLRGALPVLLDRKPSHFECDHWDVKDFVRTYPDVQSGHRSKYALAIRWGADADAASSAYSAAAGYARATGGFIFDCQEGAVISLERAIEIADELKHSGPAIEAAVRTVMQRFRRGK
jgi:hypothetical protein